MGNKFLTNAQGMLGFDTNPIYALLHEAIYCQHQVSPVFFTFFLFLSQRDLLLTCVLLFCGLRLVLPCVLTLFEGLELVG